MFGISKKHYECGLRTGHDFGWYERKYVEEAFESCFKYTFKCLNCGYTYTVRDYALNSTEKASIANYVNFDLCKDIPSNKDN